MRMKPVNIVEYFATARERHAIYLSRCVKKEGPWTKDPIFQTWRFCNVFRELDKTTEWIRENINPVLETHEQAITAMTACRLFNRIETLQILLDRGLLAHWDTCRPTEVLRGVQPVVGGAYVVKSLDGYSKAEGVCRMVDAVFGARHELAPDLRREQSLRYAWEALQRFPCIGSFIAYEIVSDLRHCDILRCARDVMTWAVPGPGACRGLSWLIANNAEVLGYGGRLAKEYALPMMQELLELSTCEAYWPREWPRWEMREVEHWLCEHYKWVRAKYLGQPMKRRFP